MTEEALVSNLMPDIESTEKAAELKVDSIFKYSGDSIPREG